MKPLLINTNDSYGGAAIAAYRLHQALQQIGVDSRMLVQHKNTCDDTVIGPRPGIEEKLSGFRSYVNRHLFYLYPKRDKNVIWSINAFPHRIAMKINSLDPDIVHMHWISSSIVPISEIPKIEKPIVWTLHDMWAFTGGCHYSGECTRYKQQCGRGPQLGSHTMNDISSFVWKRKVASWKNTNLVLVCPSKWLAECAKQSTLFKNRPIQVIPNGLDTSQFRPYDKIAARSHFSLPQDKKLILFGAFNATTDKRKGFHLLKESLKIFSEEDDGNNTDLVLFGNSQENEIFHLKMKTHSLGRIPDASLPLLYSAADVFIAPSLEENLSNTVMESMACGTPVAAFNIGGMQDMIDHKHNGYLAEPFDCQDFAGGIIWILNDEDQRLLLSEASRKKVELEYESTHIARQYLDIYEKILNIK